MGRGLSQLQRHILTEAGQRERVHPAEILMSFFGWPYKPTCLHDKPRALGERPHGNNFSPAQIGPLRYTRTMASLSRAVRRLEDRGLVERFGYTFGKAWCLKITDKGRQVLSVNNAPTAHSVNR
jgi:hypothetical protein